MKDAPVKSFKNRKSLTGSCGCFHCLEVFDVGEIKEWTDGGETAICPKCDNDTVINFVSNLKEICDFWYGKRKRS